MDIQLDCHYVMSETIGPVTNYSSRVGPVIARPAQKVAPASPQAGAVSLRGDTDEAHSQICRDDAGKAAARPAYGRDWPSLRDHGARRRVSRHDAQAIKLIDAEGRSCIYVPIMQDG